MEASWLLVHLDQEPISCNNRETLGGPILQQKWWTHQGYSFLASRGRFCGSCRILHVTATSTQPSSAGLQRAPRNTIVVHTFRLGGRIACVCVHLMHEHIKTTVYTWKWKYLHMYFNICVQNVNAWDDMEIKPVPHRKKPLVSPVYRWAWHQARQGALLSVTIHQDKWIIQQQDLRLLPWSPVRCQTTAIDDGWWSKIRLFQTGWRASPK